MEDIKDKLFEKRGKVLQKISISVYIAIIIIHIAMFFVMGATGLIYVSKSRFVIKYMIKPIGVSTINIVIGFFMIHRTSNVRVKNLMHILMLTLMLSNIAYVHHVYSVLLITFCVPIFLTVILQDKRVLTLISIICETVVALIALDCYVTGKGASKDTYFVPTVIIIMIVLYVCTVIAGMCINILNEQLKALIEARNEAVEAKHIADASNESKSMFLSNMSHEIRTPLNAILSLDTLIIRETNEKNIKGYAFDIRNSGQVLLSLINDILDLAKIEAGKMELIESEYELASLIHDVINMVSIKAADKNLELNLKLDETIPSHLYGDDTRIRQILVNILNNAVKYTEKGNVTLSISGEKEDDDCVLSISVKDTGIGIKEEDISKLFSEFERIEEKRNKHIEGTGLGMSITVAFLKLMGSELKVKSVYGEGSDFYFELRQRIVNDAPIGKLEDRIKNRNLDEKYKASFIAPNARVLLVDDNLMNRNVFIGLLKETQLKIDEAKSGMECINLCRRNKYNMVFLDHMMPDMDGVETLHKMKEIDDLINKDIPVIALTANAIVGAKEEYLRAGFTDYLTKPINVVSLRE